MGLQFSTSLIVTEIMPNCGYKEITVTTPLVEAGATVALTLENYVISETGLLTVHGTSMSTIYGILDQEAPTTAVSAGVLTITSISKTGTKTYRITGKSGN